MVFEQDIIIAESPPPRRCTVLSECQFGRGDLSDYAKLSQFHYRNTGKPPGTKAVYKAVHEPTGALAAVAVYTSPSMQLASRNLVFGERYKNVTSNKTLCSLVMKRLNSEMELMMRIIVHPTFRGIGLAQQLLAYSLPDRPVPYVEVSAAMGRVNPFLERAGLRVIDTPRPLRTEKLISSMRAFGADDTMIASPSRIIAWLQALKPGPRSYIEQELLAFERTWRTSKRSAAWKPGGKTQKGAEHKAPTLEDAIRRVASNALVQPRYYLWTNTERNAAS